MRSSGRCWRDAPRPGCPSRSFVDRNIEDDVSWHRRYLTTIPVLAIGGSELELATSTDKVSRFLAEALDGPAPR